MRPAPPAVSIVSRILAAVLGGYALATSSGAALAGLLPASRADAVLGAMLSAFAIHAAAVLWAFAARSATRAWFGLLAPTAIFAALWFVTGR